MFENFKTGRITKAKAPCGAYDDLYFVLLPDTEPRNNRSIPRHVFFFQIIQQTTTFSDHTQQSPTGMMILGVNLEVFRKIRNFFTQDGDLYLRRTCISLMGLIRPDKFRFSFRCQ